MPFRRSERIKSPESSPPSWPPDIDSVDAQQSNNMERLRRGPAIDGGASSRVGEGRGVSRRRGARVVAGCDLRVRERIWGFLGVPSGPHKYHLYA